MNNTKILKASSLTALQAEIEKAKKENYLILSSVISKDGWHEVMVLQFPMPIEQLARIMYNALDKLQNDTK